MVEESRGSRLRRQLTSRVRSDYQRVEEGEMPVVTMDKQFRNILLLGLAFFLIFTAFQTGGMIQETVVKSIVRDRGFTAWDGYTSLCIVYAVFALSNWIAPSTVSLLGPKISMFLAAITYCLFVANFLYPMNFGLYTVSSLVGVGAAVIWTAQGNYLTINSNADTIGRNSGVFWALLQCSLLFGNLFVYFEFQDQVDDISKTTLLTTYSVLTVVGTLGTSLLLFLGNSAPTEPVESTESPSTSTVVDATADSATGPKEALLNSIRLLKTRRMLLLCVTFFYTGIELSFFSGVYGTVIGATNALGKDAKRLIGISGMLIGVGEILGGAVFGLLGKKTTKHGREPIVILGYVLHMVAFFLIFVNLPFDASTTTTTTDSVAYIESSVFVALLCSFLLGLGDSCFNTQIYSILGSVYSDDSAPAFALFKFVQSLAAAAGFLYSKSFGLDVHVYILSIFATLGTISFCLLEWTVYRETYRVDKARRGSPGEVSTSPLSDSYLYT